MWQVAEPPGPSCQEAKGSGWASSAPCWLPAPSGCCRAWARAFLLPGRQLSVSCASCSPGPLLPSEALKTQPDLTAFFQSRALVLGCEQAWAVAGPCSLWVWGQPNPELCSALLLLPCLLL